MNWLSKLLGREKRRFRRHLAPPLTAFYWDGGHSTPRVVPDISQNGIFIRTEDRWFPRTLMRVTLQRKSNDPKKSEESITLQCRVVRAGEDGVGMAIMFADEDKSPFPVRLGSTATRKQLGKFIERLLAEERESPIPATPHLPFPGLATLNIQTNPDNPSTNYPPPNNP